MTSNNSDGKDNNNSELGGIDWDTELRALLAETEAAQEDRVLLAVEKARTARAAAGGLTPALVTGAAVVGIIAVFCTDTPASAAVPVALWLAGCAGFAWWAAAGRPDVLTTSKGTGRVLWLPLRFVLRLACTAGRAVKRAITAHARRRADYEDARTALTPASVSLLKVVPPLKED